MRQPAPTASQAAALGAAPRSVTEILARIGQTAGDGETTVGELVASLGSASFAAILILPALAVVSPLSGIPLFSSFCGAMIALVAVQMLSGRDHLWLPKVITGRHLQGERVRHAVASLRRPAAWLDRVTAPRLSVLVHGPFRIVSQLLSMLCGLAMPFLELLPFTSSILGLAVVLLAMSMVLRDGVFALAGFAVAAVAVAAFLGLTSLLV